MKTLSVLCLVLSLCSITSAHANPAPAPCDQEVLYEINGHVLAMTTSSMPITSNATQLQNLKAYLTEMRKGVAIRGNTDRSLQREIIINDLGCFLRLLGEGLLHNLGE